MNDGIIPIIGEISVVPLILIMAFNAIISAVILREVCKVIGKKYQSPIYLNWASQALMTNIISFLFSVIAVIVLREIDITLGLRYAETIFWYTMILSLVYYALFQTKFLTEKIFPKWLRKFYIFILHVCIAYTIFCFMVDIYSFVSFLDIKTGYDAISLLFVIRWPLIFIFAGVIAFFNLYVIQRYENTFLMNARIMLAILFMIEVMILTMTLTRTLLSTYLLALINSAYLVYMKRHIANDKGRFLDK